MCLSGLVSNFDRKFDFPVANDPFEQSFKWIPDRKFKIILRSMEFEKFEKDQIRIIFLTCKIV